MNENIVNFTGNYVPVAQAVLNVSDSEAEIDKYTTEAMSCCDYHEMEDYYEREGVHKNVSAWLENKMELITLLRKHPNWDEEKKSVVIRGVETRSASIEDKWSKLYNLINWAVRSNFEFPFPDISVEYKNLLRELLSIDCVSQSMSERLAAYGIDAPVGLKTSRAMRRALTKVKLYDYNKDEYLCMDITTLETGCKEDKTYDSFEKRFAVLSDMMSKKEIKRTFVLSLNFCDYLSMSMGNSWRSCHNLIDGEYRSGCLSYAEDKTSMIFYTLPEEPGEKEFLWKNSKINRQVFMFNGNTLVQSRLYPQREEYMHDISDIYRNTVQKIFETCNSELKFQLSEISSDNIAVSDAGYHYQDVDYFRDRCHVSYTGQEPTKVHYGANGYCLKCGKKICNSESFNCPICNDGAECYECGEYNDEDYMHWVYHEGREVLVCDNCFEEYYRYCEDDHEYHHEDDVEYINSEDKYVTREYFDDHYYLCDECEEAFNKDYVVVFRDYYFCPNCASERIRDYLDELDKIDVNVLQKIAEII